MLACLDVHYGTSRACAAAVVFSDWADAMPLRHYATQLTVSAAYEPGRFYLRELGPLLAVIELIREPIEVYIIDGYCQLSADGMPGLGAHLYAALEGGAAVIGVAKNRFRQSRHAAEILRGGSRRPLFVTAMGLPQTLAASRIATMAGRYRLPALVRAADQLARRCVCR